MRWTSGDLVGFDLETTSINPFTALPCSYALSYKVGDKLRTKCELINPGVPIPPATTEIHGITDEMVKAEGRDLTEVVQEISAELIRLSAARVPIVGMNISYDLTIIDVLCRDLLGFSLAETGWDGPVLDIYVLDKAAHRFRKGSRRLSALCKHYEIEIGEAHDAAADARACLRVLFKMTEKFQWLGVKPATELHRLQTKWYDAQIKSLSEYLVEEGEEPVPTSEFGWPIHNGFTEGVESASAI